MKKCIVVTTINKPTRAIKKIIERDDYDVIIVGDKKTPSDYHGLNCIFLDVTKQRSLFPEFDAVLPFNHYARKNMGYLYAAINGYHVIAESDDDNIPYKGWGNIELFQKVNKITKPRFPNIYKLYTDQQIWARGFPLDYVNTEEKVELEPFENLSQISVWQGLANKDPDIDAIFRLTSPIYRRPFYFGKSKKVYVLNKGCIHPGNTQNTICTDKSIFPFLYIPSTVTFRHCDILRSYVLLFTLFSQNKYIAFTPATMYQQRNKHDFMKDFEDEIPMNVTFHKVIAILEKMKYPINLLSVYEILYKHKIVQKQELTIIAKFLDVLKRFSYCNYMVA